MLKVNPYPAEFLKLDNSPSIFGIFHYHFWGYQDENLKLASQQYRAWFNCMDMQIGLVLYWWQRLRTTLGFGRIKVKCKPQKLMVLMDEVIKF